ncbi:MAG: hypothetical protein V1880_03760 [Patescibacteria group bacterium]
MLKKFIPKGSTFIELVIYLGIFLVLTPILFSVAINSLRVSRTYQLEKQINSDAQFSSERIYDLITGAKRIDFANSSLNTDYGKLALINQNDEEIIIELNPDTERIEITEDEVTSTLSSLGNRVTRLYFEKIPDDLDDPEIALGINIRMKMSGAEAESVEQNYVLSANLQRGDFDNDGCPDFIDDFPRNPECCGDRDADGICNELDNCILEYNPFQTDFDADSIGDKCDAQMFFPGTEPPSTSTYTLAAYNCSNDEQLIAILNYDPPVESKKIKDLFISSSPLSPTVLSYLITKQENDEIMKSGDFRKIFEKNVKLNDAVYQNVLTMTNINDNDKDKIIKKQQEASSIAWQGGDQNANIWYEVNLDDHDHRIEFRNADPRLGENDTYQTDVFILTTDGVGTLDQIEIKSKSDGEFTNYVTQPGDSFIDQGGFKIRFDSIKDNSYALTVQSYSNTKSLEKIKFEMIGSPDDGHDDEDTMIVINPTEAVDYISHRLVNYCPGGCEDECEDGGSGILTGPDFNDQCYKTDSSYPEWCHLWKTFNDDDSLNMAYMGGTQIGEESLYWEKNFETVLSDTQLEKLKKITVTGEVAYQNIAQFYCDQLDSDCPMNGNLVGPQPIELYNWNTGTWDVIGNSDLDDSTSDQQKFKVKYDGSNPQRFVGGEKNNSLKARIEFHWNGIAPGGSTNAPSLMLIDYFTVHLKW